LPIVAAIIEPNGFGNRDLVERVKVRTFHADRKEGQRLRFFRGMDLFGGFFPGIGRRTVSD
jgi:hypothetical protein